MELFLFLDKEAAIFGHFVRRVRKEGHNDEADADGHNTLDDEDPPVEN